MIFPWNKNNVVPDTPSTVAMSSGSDYAFIEFPVAPFGRVQTPVRRVPADKLWSQPDSWVPEGYGGPVR